MKKRFTFLIVAIAAILIMTLPEKVVGQNSYEITCNMSDQGWSNSTAISSGTLKTKVNGTATNTVFTYTSGTGDSGTTEGPKYFTSGSNVRFYVLKASSGSTANGNWMQISIPSNTTVTAIEITGVSSYSPNIKYNIDGGSDVSCSASNNKYTVSSISATTSFKFRNVNTSTSTNTQLRITAIKITYTTSGGGSTVNTPEIIPNGGSFYPTQDVELSCTTEGASIYYTTDGTEPSSSSTLYSSAFTISSSCTVKAIATKSGMTNSSVAEATFTKITPLANIAALSSQTEAGTYYVTLDDAVVTFTNGYYAYIQDESGAILYYKNGHGLSAGQRFTGTANVTLAFDNNNPEITTLSGVTPTSGDAPEPTTVVASAWNYTFNNVLSQYIKITDAQITNTSGKYYVSVGSAKAVQSIQLYGRGDANNFSISNLSLDDRFTIVGFPTLYKSTNEFVIFAVPQKEDIYIGSSSEIQLSYAANASGSMTVGYSNFTPTSVTAALYSDSGCSSSFSGDWISITSPLTTPFTSLAYNVSANETGADRTVYMKINATNANGTIIHKIFTITQVLHQTYSVTYKANGGTGDDVVDSGYDYNTTVTVKPNNGNGTNPGFSKAGYTFQNWNTNAGGTGTTYIPNNNEHNTFNITANTNLFAQWQATTYDLHTAAMTNGSVSFKVNNADATTANTDQTVTLVVTPDQGYKLSTFTVTNDATSATVTVTNNTFTMPASSITVSATFEEYYALTIDFESALNTYSNWSFDKITRSGESTSAHGGSYYATNSSNQSSATITTVNKIAKPGKLTFWVKRTSNNTNTANWRVKTKTENGSWTERGSQDATPADWTKFELDLSSYENVYVQIAYDGNTALRAIDDISLEYTPSEFAVSVSDVDNGTISASDGTTTITSGSGNFETGKTITLTAEGDATHMFSAWTVTGATVDDASSATTTFEMPANAVTVSATFVECWTFTYNINGNVVTEKYAKNGASITLPITSEFVPEGYVIIGWTATEGDVSDPITNAEANQNRTLYAVFSKIVYGDFVKITSSNTPTDWTGYYLIVYEKTGDNKAFNSGLTTLDANGNIIGVSISDGSIAFNNTTKAAMVTIASNGTNTYSIKAANGSYIGATSNGSLNTTETNTTYQHELSISNDAAVVKCGSVYLKYNASSSRYRYYTSSQQAIQLYKASSSYEGAYTHIYPSNATANANIDVSVSGPIVIESGATLNMGSYSLANVDAAKLVIEDGAQLILPKTNKGVQATVKKEIHEATAKDATYWYAISSTVDNPIISSETNLTEGTYDLYRYNEAATATNAQGQILYWENYKAGHADFTTLEQGRGYLYRNASTVTIEMAGEVNVTDVNYPVTKTGSGVLAGFNLIGNPYSHDIYKGAETAIPNGTDFLRTGFYYMNPADGSWTPGTDGNTVIKPNEGILVQTDKSGNIEMTNTNSNGAKYNNDNIMFKVANSQYSDETYAWFDKGRGLNKISHRNAEVPMLYINQDGEDYAIATMSDDIKTFSLNFKAMTMGKYTLSYKTKGEINYLHVIDRLTGEDVDMLLEGEYSFVASPSDSDARFIVKLAYLPDYSDGEGDIFAYQNGSDIFVSGEGELQIFDVMGRFVMSERINGVKTISADELSKGVYVLRLVGNGMKTQKIVVK